MNENIDITKYLLGFLKRWKIYVPTGLFFLLIAVIFILVYSPIYKMNARLQLKEDSKSLASQMQVLASNSIVGSLVGAGLKAVNADNETIVISSRQNIRNAIMATSYQTEIRQRHGLRNTLLYGTDAPFMVQVSETVLDTLSRPVKLSVTVKGNQIKEIKASSSLFLKQTFPQQPFPALISLPVGVVTIQSSQPVQDGKYQVTIQPLQYVYEKLDKELYAEVEGTISDVILLSVNDESRQRGCALLNALMAGFNDLSQQAVNNDANRMKGFIMQQLDSVSTDLVALEAQIQDFQQKHHISEPQLYAKSSVEGDLEMDSRMLELETELKYARSVASFFNKDENRYASIPSFEGLDSDVLTHYNQLILHRQQLAKDAGSSNPAFIAADEQLSSQRDLLQKAINTGITSLESSLAAVRQKKGGYASRLAEMPADTRSYTELKRLQNIKQSVYLFLVGQLQEKMLVGAPDEEVGRVLDSAFSSYKPVFPRKSIVFAVAFLLAFMTSLIIYVVSARKS